MSNKNKIKIIEEGDSLPKLPEGLSDGISIVSPYGFKITQIDGKPMWEVGTEEDYRNAESIRLGISPEKVEPKDNAGKTDDPKACYSIGPRKCNLFKCGGMKWCKLVYNPAQNYYYCACR